jgi:membrane protease YdiL (CAAX protease family)
MTAIALPRPPSRIVRPAIIVGGLTGIVGLRWAATVSAVGDALTIGLAFGVCLLAVAIVGGWRAVREPFSSVEIGAAGGGVLVLLAVVTRSGELASLAPAAGFAPWAAVTVLVASAEELVLRGALFDELDRSVGAIAAVLVTSVVFAIMHVPLYGWHVVPLDLGVGLWLGGLRLGTGGVAAPVTAHVIADLATWWL